jgi:branched-chain amino acid transport system substrate-binding protein
VRPLTGEEVRYGLENLNLDAKRIEALGLAGVIRPLATNCRDHEGSRWARIQTWDGTKWSFSSDWYESDAQIIKPMIRDTSARYATEKKITRRSCEAEMAAAAKAAPVAAPAKAAAPAAKK